MVTTPITRASTPERVTPQDFERRFVRAGRPVLLEGFVEAWPARSWDFPHIHDQLPRRTILGRGASSSDGLSVRDFQLSPDDIVRDLADDGGTRSAPDWFFDVATELPELAPAVPVPNVHRGVMRYSILIGRDTRTRGHYHAYEHAMICQVHGKKRVILYAPTDSARLYPYPFKRRASQHEHSRADFADPDFQAFPRLAQARPFEAIVEPGDALLIPVRWWHAVYGVGPVMSASLLWTARLQEYPRPTLRALGILRRAMASRWRVFGS